MVLNGMLVTGVEGKYISDEQQWYDASHLGLMMFKPACRRLNDDTIRREFCGGSLHDFSVAGSRKEKQQRKDRRTYMIRSLSNVVLIPFLSSDLAPC